MPMIDMPLEKMQTYMGCNECPEDLDAYWDKAIAEMEGLGTACELIPAAFQVPGVECFDLWVRGVGGARIHAHYVRPSGGRELPAVVKFHGYSNNSGSFASLLNWAAAGFCCAAMDCRGQGGLSEDNGVVQGTTHKGQIVRGLGDPDAEKLYFRAVFLDAAQLARIASPALFGCTRG